MIRPMETHIGSSKRSLEYWVIVIKPGRIIYEMSGVAKNIASKSYFNSSVQDAYMNSIYIFGIGTLNQRKEVLGIKNNNNNCKFLFDKQYFLFLLVRTLD